MALLFAVLHHAAVVTLLACAFASICQWARPLTLSGALFLRRVDLVNGIAATLVLVAGLVRVFYLEKGAAYYFNSGPFLAKLGLYGLASLLSLVPTLEVRRWRAPLQQGRLPTLSAAKLAAMRVVACLQLACLAAMGTCAHLAARGLQWPLPGP